MKTIVVMGCMIALLIPPASVIGQDFTLYDVHVVNVRTGTVQRLTTIANAGEFNPTFSPDGKKIAHDVVTLDSHELYITDVGSRVSAPIPGADGGNDAAWSPTGSLIAFDRVPYGDMNLYTVPPSGGVTTLIQTDAVDASWSPTGSYIVFYQPSDGSIRVTPSTGGSTTFVGGGENPAWSPNGEYIAFSVAGDLWLARVNGSGVRIGPPVQLTSGPEWDGQPSWSNNSKTIVFHSNLGGADFDLWTIPAAGGTPTRLTGLAGAGDYDPAFSSNGKLVAFAALPSGSSIAGHSPGTTTAFSIAVSALKGPTTTDVCVSLTSADANAYPLPSSFKKIQIKVKDARGSLITILNASDVQVVNGKACFSLEDLSLYQAVRIQAHVKTDESIDEEVLRAIGTVFLRPDLTVEGVSVPEQVHAYMPFNIEARIRELNRHVAVTATVSLYDREILLASVPGVRVPGRELVSVVFERILFTEAGTRTLTVRITDADPAEYDVTNNDREFSIEVLERPPIEPMSYYMGYDKGVSSYTERFASCWLNYENERSDQWQSLYFSAYVMPDVIPETPFDAVSWKIESENGVWNNGSQTEVTAVYGDPFFEYYFFNLDPSKPLFAYIFVEKNEWYRSVNFSLSYYASRWVYRYTENGVVFYDFSGQSGSLDFDAAEWINVSILLSDDGFSAGGGARMVLNAQYESAYGNHESGYDPYHDCNYELEWQNSSRYSSTFQFGVTDVSSLPLASSNKTQFGELSSMTGVVEIPKITTLSPNFPNPFNPSTNLYFTVEERGHAMLKVYNALGQEVAELFNGEAIAGKMYQFRFNAEMLPTGFYVARLETGGKQFTRKLLFTK